MYMSNGEICREYRWAKNQDEQIRILSELNVADLVEIILVLYENGEQLTNHAYSQLQQRLDVLNAEIVDRENHAYSQLQQRLDVLNAEIVDRERAYRRIAAALNGR